MVLVPSILLWFLRRELSGNKAAGVDEVTKAEYTKKLEDNIDSLVERIKKHNYKPKLLRWYSGHYQYYETLEILKIFYGYFFRYRVYTEIKD